MAYAFDEEDNYPFLNNVKITLQKENTSFNSGRAKIKRVRKFYAVQIFVGTCAVFLSTTFFSSIKTRSVDSAEREEFSKSPVVSEEVVISSFDDSIMEGKEILNSVGEVDNPLEVVEMGNADTITEVRQDTIRYYCQVYSVSFEKVYNKIVALTDHFSNENFVQYLTIEGVLCKNKQPYADNEEELFIYAIRAMAQTPEAFGFDESLYVESTFVSEVDYTAIIDHYAHVFQLDRRLVYAIISSETSFNSDLFLNKNNPAGIRIHGEFVKYDNLDRGMIEFCTELLKYHFRDGANTLEELRDIHAPLSDGNIYWLSNVTSIYTDLVSGVKEPFSNDFYQLWYHNGDEVYSDFVSGEQETFFGDRELYINARGLK